MQFLLNCSYETLSLFSSSFLTSLSLPDNFLDVLSMFVDICNYLNFYVPLDIYAFCMLTVITVQGVLFLVSANLQLF